MSGKLAAFILLPFTASSVFAAAPATRPTVATLTTFPRAHIDINATSPGAGDAQAVPGHVTVVTEKFDAASITLMGSPAGMGVIVGRAGDALGSPVDFGRYLASQSHARPGQISIGSGVLPSRLPVAAIALTSGFGMRTHPLLDMRRMHAGVDLAAPMGSPIVAPSDGVVRFANWRGGYGMFIDVDHGGGIETRYGHMSRLNVTAGQRVRAGDVLGFVGSTGLSTGPHLHYEVRVNGQPVNPLARRPTR